MNIEKEFFKREQEILDHYLKSKIDELRIIKPHWAYGPFVDKLLDFSLHPINEEYSFSVVCLRSLVTNSEFFEVNLQNLFTGEELNDHRIGRILFHWENKGYLDPPQISIGSDGVISFTDGRHRTKCALFLGQDEIPVAIHKSELLQLQKVLSLKAALL